MKSIVLYTMLFLVLSISFVRCTTSKSVKNERKVLYIELKEELNAKYILKAYSSYNPAKISNSNKTLNQYRVAFTCTEKEWGKLNAILVQDSNVINSKEDTSVSNIETSKNQEHAKIKPIKSNNN